MRIVSAALAALLLAAASASADPIEISTTSVPLDEGNPLRQSVGALEFKGALWLRSPDDRFGGLSSLAMLQGGERIVAVSDHGYWFTARLRETGDGRLVGLEQAEFAPMLDDRGRPLGGRYRDAESVTVAGGGRLMVGFERDHRIWSYNLTGDLTRALPRPYLDEGDFGELPNNGSLEALTTLADGRFLIITEDSRDQYNDLRGWVVSGGAALTPITLAETGEFRPTDLTTLPNGDVILLERQFSVTAGLSCRISLITADTLQPDARLISRELAVLAPPTLVDNCEGIAAAATAEKGVVAIYVQSDNNFKPILQRTLLIKFLYRL
ncbi:esterase-like activity of phytase family protein [Oceanibacterium hippocampi]|uniref:Phytase-like domain-containing protein n=1 Tax=Oceanibacterium hippocampi TaxID=745714 RepID=A0A1Y5S5F9_9PROT|nr:esterase-like activity of phytase family protein [Oceanibacterium hippocampi]SLN32515.1 hypothetical protein OCH7691_01210 [Oceanibacterium hippocampi]